MNKKMINDVLKISIFIALVNLPFVTMAGLIGLDEFTDSFENPESYQYFKTNKIELETDNTGFIVVQKPSHPDFSIHPGDDIFFYKDEGGLMCRSIYHVHDQGFIKKYYVVLVDGSVDEDPIFESQIIGKVVSTVDNNPWNMLSLKFWDASINNLNAVAMLVNN